MGAIAQMMTISMIAYADTDYTVSRHKDRMIIKHGKRFTKLLKMISFTEAKQRHTASKRQEDSSILSLYKMKSIQIVQHVCRLIRSSFAEQQLRMDSLTRLMILTAMNLPLSSEKSIEDKIN